MVEDNEGGVSHMTPMELPTQQTCQQTGNGLKQLPCGFEWLFFLSSSRINIYRQRTTPNVFLAKMLGSDISAQELEAVRLLPGESETSSVGYSWTFVNLTFKSF